MVEEKGSGDVLLEGWLLKRSRVVKKWRNRWFILTPTNLFSFKDSQSSANATEIIHLREFISITPVESKRNKNRFCITTKKGSFNLGASSDYERDKWIEAISRLFPNAPLPTQTEEPAQTEVPARAPDSWPPEHRIEQFQIN
jgi:hypothetical protein